MTESEAINFLKNNEERLTSSRYVRIKQLSISSLEKQIPKKDKNDSLRCKNCGTCNNFIINKLANPKGHPVIYCWNCGQAIDWSDEE